MGACTRTHTLIQHDVLQCFSSKGSSINRVRGSWRGKQNSDEFLGNRLKKVLVPNIARIISVDRQISASDSVNVSTPREPPE